MLSNQELFECLTLLLALRLTSGFQFDFWIHTLPFLRPLTPWLVVSCSEIYETALLFCPRVADPCVTQVLLASECSRSLPFSCFTADTFRWVRKMWLGKDIAKQKTFSVFVFNDLIRSFEVFLLNALSIDKR